MKRRTALALVLTTLTLSVFLAPRAEAARPPEIYSVIEGRDSASQRPVLVLMGKKMTKIKGADLVDPLGLVSLDATALLSRDKASLVLGLPDDIAPGTYRLTLFFGKGEELEMDVTVGSGRILPGAIRDEGLDADLRADLDDAETLGGATPSYYLDASNLDAGTLSPDRFSAHDDLAAEGRIGTGANQVAAGDHGHDDRYVPRDDLATAGTINAAGNPVDWTRLKGVPAGLTDGEDADTTYTAGNGLALDGTEFSVDAIDWSWLTGVPADLADGDDDTTYRAGTGLRLDLEHQFHVDLDTIPTRSLLAAETGTINASGNPVDWSQLKGVPAGFADGTDAGSPWTVTDGNLELDTGLVDIGSLAPGWYDPYRGRLHVTLADAEDEVYYGILGDAGPKGYAGVFGRGSNGVHGASTSKTGWGVVGGGNAYEGTGGGVLGYTTSYQGIGVKGEASYATSGFSYGVFGTSVSKNGTGVFAGMTGDGWALRAVHSGSSGLLAAFQVPSGNGVADRATIDLDGKGVFNGGLQGLAPSASAWGVHAVGNRALYAESPGTSGTTILAHRPHTGSGRILDLEVTQDDVRSSVFSVSDEGDVVLSGSLTATGKIDWSNLTNVPSGLGDGDADTTYTAGTGLSLDGENQFHVDSVTWSQLTAVPAGLADGDDDTTYAAGTGLDLVAGTFNVNGNLGIGCTVSPKSSLAVGNSNAASGPYSAALNYRTTASGQTAVALGESTTAQARSSLVIGQWNTIAGSTTSWTSTDPLFVAGNGSGSAGRSNALTLLKNGDLTIAGKFTATGKIDWSNLTNVPNGLADGDADTTYTAGTGLALDGTEFSVDSVDWSKLANVPAGLDDGDADTTYTAGSGLALSGTTFSVDSVDWSKLTNVPAGLADGDDASNWTVVNGDLVRSSKVSVTGGVTVTGNDSAETLKVTNAAAGTGTAIKAVRANGTAGGLLLDLAYRKDKQTGDVTVFEVEDSGDTTITGTDTGLTVTTSASGSNTLVVDYLGGQNTSKGSGQTNGPADNIALFKADGTVVGRIDVDGKFYGKQFNTSGADFAESVAVKGGRDAFEPGDLIVIDVDTDRQFALSSSASSTLVAGVYATQPGVLAMPRDAAGDDQSWADKEIPMAVVGIVPTKVCDEGGPIRRGDLLVTSSVPGHAMKAPADVKPGTIIGKALGEHAEGTGRIEILLSLQ